MANNASSAAAEKAAAEKEAAEKKAAAKKEAAAKAAAKKEAASPKPVRVRAVRMGYVHLKRRKPGEEFDFQLAEGQKLPSWVEEVKQTAPAQDEPAKQEPPDGSAGAQNTPVI